MKSTLIRFMSSKYKEPVMAGELYMSPLSGFLNLNGITNKNIKGQQDFSEGILVQMPHDVIDKIPSFTSRHTIHDVRFYIEAYCYCKLLCFYRIDATDFMGDYIISDEDNLLILAKEKGIKGINSYEDIKKLPDREKAALSLNVYEPNPLFGNPFGHIIQLPSKDMDKLGDTVLVIKDEEEFINRILKVVRDTEGECITGDIRYHDLQDTVNPDTMIWNSADSILEDAKYNEVFDLKSLLGNRTDIIRYGSLDKYGIYSSQKEWRVCWLPDEYDLNPKKLNVGDLSDIADIVDTKDIRRYLLKLYKGYVPGIVYEQRKRSRGTINYKAFKNKVENIDGKCRLIFGSSFNGNRLVQ